MERINYDLERSLQDSGQELTELRNAQRRNREVEAAQQDVVMEWQSKLHDKEQEINLLVDKYDKKLKSMQTELEERDTNLTASRETISSLNHKCKKFEKELESMTTKKQKYHALFQKQEKLSLRLQNEK